MIGLNIFDDLPEFSIVKENLEKIDHNASQKYYPIEHVDEVILNCSEYHQEYTSSFFIDVRRQLPGFRFNINRVKKRIRKHGIFEAFRQSLLEPPTITELHTLFLNEVPAPFVYLCTIHNYKNNIIEMYYNNMIESTPVKCSSRNTPLSTDDSRAWARFMWDNFY